MMPDFNIQKDRVSEQFILRGGLDAGFVHGVLYFALDLIYVDCLPLAFCVCLP